MAVFIGLLLRLGQYLSNQSYWEDESALILNVLHFSGWELPFHVLNRVPMTQAAPPIFLLYLKAMTRLAGTREWALRLLPLIVSLASVAVFAVVCRRALARFTTPWLVPGAVGFFAVADNLVFQSASVKQYSGDVLAALLIWGVAFAWREDDGPLRRLIRASVVTAAAIWFSYTSIFVFASVALALLPELIGGPRRLLLALLPVVISAALLYVVTLRVQRDAYLALYWHERFIDWSHPLQIPLWVAGRTFEMFRFGVPPAGGILFVPAIAGAMALHRTLPRAQWLSLILPFPLALLASAVRMYPYGGTRVTLYLVPFQLMLVAAGIVQCGLLIPDRIAWKRLGIRLVAAAAAVLWLIPAGLAAYRLAVPRTHGDSRQAIAYMRSQRIAGTPVYAIGESTSYDLMIYWPDHDSGVTLFASHTAQFPDPRFWIVLSYYPEKNAREFRVVLDQREAHPDASQSAHSAAGDAVLYVRKDSAP